MGETRKTCLDVVVVGVDVVCCCDCCPRVPRVSDRHRALHAFQPAGNKIKIPISLYPSPFITEHDLPGSAWHGGGLMACPLSHTHTRDVHGTARRSPGDENERRRDGEGDSGLLPLKHAQRPVGSALAGPVETVACHLG